MKPATAWLVLLIHAGNTAAETVYVTDNLSLSLKSEADSQSKTVKSLPSGTPLTALKGKKIPGFTRVRTESGHEGYMQNGHITKELPVRLQLENANKLAKALQAETLSLQAELKIVKDSITPGTSLEKSLAAERDRLSLELNELKAAAAGVVQLKNEHNELQERVVSSERELQQLKLENQALKDTAEQDWFLYGGTLVFFSVILGFLLPKLGWQRKNRWDSF